MFHTENRDCLGVKQEVKLHAHTKGELVSKRSAHGKAEDEDGLEESRVPQHHGDGEAVVEDRQHRVEHEDRKCAVAHPGEDGGSHSHGLGLEGWRVRAPGRAAAVHGV